MAEAKAKKRKRGDEEAIAEYEKKLVTPVKASDDEKRHRDAVPTGQILNIMADVIEEVFAENGKRIDRLNAREFYAMNIWRDLVIKHKVSAREVSMKVVLCPEHTL